MDRRRILFVDDEPKILHGLRRMLHAMRREWDMSFVQSGQEALATLERNPFDVIVADIRMPGMDGSQLLMEVEERHPKMVRIILSGQADDGAVLRAVRHAHQYLSKPCDTETLRSTMARACALNDLLENETLRQLTSQMKALPSLPSLYYTIEQELESPDPSPRKVAEVVSQDIGMSAKVLQLVNSAFFGVRRQVATPEQAAILLGLETIKNLVLSVHAFSQFDQANVEGLSLRVLWDHSMTVGAYARQLAKAEDVDPKSVDYAFTGGLLHDAGKVVLAANLPEEYASARTLANEQKLPLHEAEHETFGACHAEVGCYLMGLWGLPNPIMEALAFHHSPTKHIARDFDTVTAVHVANILEHEAPPAREEGTVSELDHTYLAELGLAERLPIWDRICQGGHQGGDGL